MLSEKRKNFMIFMFPSILILMVTIAGPLLYSFVTSFFSTDLKYSGLGEFVGFQNYMTALQDRYFIDSILTTFHFSIFVVAMEFIIGFGIEK